jgi:hypothetical protein
MSTWSKYCGTCISQPWPWVVKSSLWHDYCFQVILEFIGSFQRNWRNIQRIFGYYVNNIPIGPPSAKSPLLQPRVKLESARQLRWNVSIYFTLLWEPSIVPRRVGGALGLGALLTAWNRHRDFPYITWNRKCMYVCMKTPGTLVFPAILASPTCNYHIWYNWNNKTNWIWAKYFQLTRHYFKCWPLNYWVIYRKYKTKNKRFRKSSGKSSLKYNLPVVGHNELCTRNIW